MNIGADDEDKIVIGLGFGRTYSGVAYLFTGEEKPEPLAVDEWPGAKGSNKPKVLTLIQHDDAPGTKISWGYELFHSTSVNKLEGIKLLLDLDHPKPIYVPPSNTKAELKCLGKPAVEVAANYVSALYKHLAPT